MDGVEQVPLRVALERLGWSSSGVTDDYLRQGVVTINGVVCRSSEAMVHPVQDEILVLGLPVRGQRAHSWLLLAHRTEQHHAGIMIGEVVSHEPHVIRNVDLPLTRDYIVRFSGDLSESQLRTLQCELADRALVQREDVTIVKGHDSVAGRYAILHARFSAELLSEVVLSCGIQMLGVACIRHGPFTVASLDAGQWRRLLPHETDGLEAIVTAGLPETTSLDDVWAQMQQMSNSAGY